MATQLNLHAIARREFLLVFRNKHDVLFPLFFFVLVCVLFPLSVGPSTAKIAEMAPGMIWTAILLAVLMSVGNTYRQEYEDGSLELMTMSSQPMMVMIIIKLIIQWLSCVLPLVLLSPLIAALVGVREDLLQVLFVSLLLGTPTLTLIGAMANTLMLVVSENGMLLALIVLPLFVPILIFGTGAVNTASMGGSPDGPYYILATLLVFSLTLVPFAMVAALKTGVSQ